MNRIHGATIMLLGLTLTLSVAAADPAAQKGRYERAESRRLGAYIMLLRLRWDLYAQWKETGRWPTDAEANAALDAHGRYWNEQLAAGRTVLAGGMSGDYWDNVAEIIFTADSPEQAQELMKGDPAVKAHVFQAQVRPFDVLYYRRFVPAAPADEEARVRAVAEGIVAADNARDIEKVMSFYDDEMVNLPPGGAPIEGKAAQRPRYGELFSKNEVALVTSVEEVSVTGEYAWLRGVNTGEFRPRDGSAPRKVHDSYLMVLRRQANGDWKIFRLIWNASQPKDAIP